MGIDFARSAHSTGDMMTQLNNAGQILTRDLQANHFYAAHPGINNVNSSGINPGKLSSQRLDLLGSLPTGTLANAGGYTPPNGFFQIYSPPPLTQVPDNSEGFLLDTVTSTVLQFTAYLPQGLPQNQFVTTSPPGGTAYYSQAAEIAYFLGAPGGGGMSIGMTPPTPGLPSQQLYNLYRRQRLVAVTTDYMQSLSAPLNPATPQYYDPSASDVISFTQLPGQPLPTINTLGSFGNAYVTGPTTPMLPASRVVPNPLAPSPLATPGRVGDDIVLTNVLSFEVLATWSPNPNFMPLIPQTNVSPRPFTVQNNAAVGVYPGNNTYPVSTSPYNSNYPFDNLPPMNINPGFPSNTFDTWYKISNPYPGPNPTNNPNWNWNWNNFSLLTTPGTLPNQNLVPMPVRITALHVTIRVYDPKTKQARQNTWRVAM
jgi:hypothetical protein